MIDRIPSQNPEKVTGSGQVNESVGAPSFKLRAKDRATVSGSRLTLPQRTIFFPVASERMVFNGTLVSSLVAEASTPGLICKKNFKQRDNGESEEAREGEQEGKRGRERQRERQEQSERQTEKYTEVQRRRDRDRQIATYTCRARRGYIQR